MTFAEIEQLARREIDDEVGNGSDRYVESWQMLAYANEAEAEACIRARLLVDSTTPEICSIPLVAGTAHYRHDPRVTLILRGKLAGAINPLGKVSHTIMDELYPGWEDQTGEVKAFVTGMDKGNIRLFRSPAVNSTLNLTVVRMPLSPMVGDGDSPEIPGYLHPSLVLWIKHKAYNNQDAELFDKNRADVHLALFEQKFGRRTDNPPDVFDSMQLPRYIPSRHHGPHSLDADYF
jgi:hypothetical protein